MEQKMHDTAIAVETGASHADEPTSRSRLGLYLILGCILLVGVVIYLVVGSYIANLLQVLTNFNQ